MRFTLAEVTYLQERQHCGLRPGVSNADNPFSTEAVQRLRPCPHMNMASWFCSFTLVRLQQLHRFLDNVLCFARRQAGTSRRKRNSPNESGSTENGKKQVLCHDSVSRM